MRLYVPVEQDGKLYCAWCGNYDHRPLHKVAEKNGVVLLRCSRCFRMYRYEKKKEEMAKV